MAIMKKNRCFFTANNVKYIDYKDTDLLKKFLTSYGQIQSRRRSGVAARYQRQLSEAIKRARTMGLLPFVTP
jgi:small subunit ribosomal protein S18